jgi:hypothetical protein
VLPLAALRGKTRRAYLIDQSIRQYELTASQKNSRVPVRRRPVVCDVDRSIPVTGRTASRRPADWYRNRRGPENSKSSTALAASPQKPDYSSLRRWETRE